MKKFLPKFKFILRAILPLVLLFLFVSVARALTADEFNTKYSVKYPVGNLGGCQNFASCHAFCEDPVNFTACADFAKKQGFYTEDKVQSADSKFWQKAKDGLGCDSVQSCATLCADAANYDKCSTFAQSNQVIGGYVATPDKDQILTKAKEVLGCSSVGTCTDFCSQNANRQKCSDFAQNNGLRGGSETRGPGGCTTDNTCKAYCSDPNNFGQCSKFAPTPTAYRGPGGCDTPETCRSFCEQNADSCRSIAPFSSGRYVPVSCGQGEYFGPGGACTSFSRTTEAAKCSQEVKYWDGSSCSDKAPIGISTAALGAYFQPRPEMGNCDTPGKCYDWCKDNPGKCPGFTTNAPRPSDKYTPTVYYTPGTPVKFDPKPDFGNCDSPGSCYDWCKDHAGKCAGFDSKSPRPIDTYIPAAYYTPPSNLVYPTPPTTNYYVTPVYFTPPAGSNYSTPSYYTPGIYSTPSYYTPPAGSNYSTPSYYTPGSYYTPFGGTTYSTPPPYSTPRYYTPPILTGYTTPTYYSPSYYTPPAGSNYSTPTYNTPSYYTPYNTGVTYSTPVYYTPPPGSTYSTPTYYTPYNYPSPGTYYSYPTPGTAYSYPTPPPGSTYSTPTYYTPTTYSTPSYYTPSYYSYPTPGGAYSYPSPSYYSPSAYSYPTPSAYSYPTPSSYSYPTPGVPYSYPTPTSYSYPSPSSYSYPTPSSYSYPSPTYATPTYGTPTYSTPPPYATPPPLGARATASWLDQIGAFFSSLFGR